MSSVYTATFHASCAVSACVILCAILLRLKSSLNANDNIFILAGAVQQTLGHGCVAAQCEGGVDEALEVLSFLCSDMTRLQDVEINVPPVYDGHMSTVCPGIANARRTPRCGRTVSQ